MGQMGPKSRAGKWRVRLVVLWALGFCVTLVAFVAMDLKHTELEESSNMRPARTNSNADSSKSISKEQEDKYATALTHLKHLDINFLALDFDLTIIDEHTGGRWKGGISELAAHVRPVFKELLGAAIAGGFYLAVVTFSKQEELIAEVMGKTFPESGGEIPVHGGMKKLKKGKQKHIELATRDLERRHMRRLDQKSTVLIDDDKRNVKIARRNGYRAVLFDPDNPLQLIHDLTKLE